MLRPHFWALTLRYPHVLMARLKGYIYRLLDGGKIWFMYDCVPALTGSSTHTIIMANPSLKEINENVLANRVYIKASHDALSLKIEQLAQALHGEHADILAKLDEIIFGDTTAPSQPKSKPEIKVTGQV